ncbi:MAG: endonuclease domain-containing protein [Bacteroidales bacterium]|nr:endonuclease domain-containing protein [Bacteroidales bacterium]
MKGVSVEYPMYFGATPDIFKKAKELRKEETEAEKILWTRLNKNQMMGLQFRRQHPINKFIADFYCAKIKLIIEVDGSIHEIPENQAYDIGRSEILNDFGITVIRFSNEQVINEIESTIKEIERNVRQLLDKER